MKNCLIYVRVSSEKQVDGYSLDSQEELCRRRAEQEGYTVIKVFREEGVSATTTNRPELQDLLSFCKGKENQVDAVFVYSFSRLNRNTVDFLTIRHLLSKLGVSLISVTEPSGDSPEQRFIETILAAKDQYENENRGRNVANSMRKRFLEGYITAKPPVGYLMQKVNGKSTAIIDPATFETVRKMWYRIANEKLSTAQVAREWNKIGLRSTVNKGFKQWTKQSVSNIFANKFYMGILVSEKYGEAMGKHPQMVNEDIFYQVREIITGRRPVRKERYKLRKDFPLRGLVVCHLCDRKLSSAWSKGKNKKYPYYCCPCRGVHPTISHKKDDIEQKFIIFLKRVNMTEKRMNLFAEIIKEKYHVLYEQNDTAQEQIKADIRLLEESKRTIRQKNANGIYTDQEYLEMKDEIDTEIAIKRGLISEKKIAKIEIDTILEFMVYYLTHLDKVFFESFTGGETENWVFDIARRNHF